MLKLKVRVNKMRIHIRILEAFKYIPILEVDGIIVQCDIFNYEKQTSVSYINPNDNKRKNIILPISFSQEYLITQKIADDNESHDDFFRFFYENVFIKGKQYKPSYNIAMKSQLKDEAIKELKSFSRNNMKTNLNVNIETDGKKYENIGIKIIDSFNDSELKENNNALIMYCPDPTTAKDVILYDENNGFKFLKFFIIDYLKVDDSIEWIYGNIDPRLQIRTMKQNTNS